MPPSILQELKKWLRGDSDRRVQARRAASLITAFYYEGGTPTPHQLRDISYSGAYLYTEQRWYPGTLIRLALQTGTSASAQGEAVPNFSAVMIWAKVVRHGDDGVGLEFVDLTVKEKNELKLLLERALAVGPTARKRGESGQSLIELSLIIPFIFLLIINAVNFGAYIFAWITIADAARTGVQYASVSSTTYAQLSTVMTNTTASLKNKASLTVVYSRNANGTITCPGQGACLVAPPADPEPALYTLACVDVTYTYVPLISAFNFPRLGISLSLPPSTVHRRAVMRMTT
jgi:hypothetical protein